MLSCVPVIERCPEGVARACYFLLNVVIDAKRLEWAEKGKDLRKPEVAAQFSTQYISPLRVWCQFKGLPIPPALSTAEYHSPYRKVRPTFKRK